MNTEQPDYKVFDSITNYRVIAERLSARLPAVRTVCSHEIGRVGILERENAAVLNAFLGSRDDGPLGSLADARAADAWGRRAAKERLAEAS